MPNGDKWYDAAGHVRSHSGAEKLSDGKVRLRSGRVVDQNTIRDFMIAVGAAAALFAAFQTWSNGREIARLSGIAEIVTAHVNTAGLHR